MFKVQHSIVVLVAFITAAGCAVGGGAPVVRQADVVATPYERAFDDALQAMREMGAVASSDKERGLITGKTNSGVHLDIEVRRGTTGNAAAILVKGSLPAGKVGFGSLDEPDKFLKVYERIARKKT